MRPPSCLDVLPIVSLRTVSKGLPLGERGAAAGQREAACMLGMLGAMVK